MKSADNIEKLIRRFCIKEKSSVKTSPQMDKRILDSALAAYEQSRKPSPALTGMSVWRTIMKSPITKVAAAAVIIIALYVVLQSPNGIVPTAYALQDTIDAYTSIRSLHIKKRFTFGQVTRTDEIWVECDSYGYMNKIRYHIPIDGPLTIAGGYDQSEVWLPKHNLHLVGYSHLDRALGFDVSQVDPKGAIERLYQQEELGEIILDVNEPVQKDKPIVVTVTYPAGSLSENWKKVFYIDQATKLVKKIEKFELRNGQYQHFVTSEFFDYNQQIDPAMFNFEGEIPADAAVIDMSDVEAGLLQDDMTDEEVATEITHQFFEALIAKDFAKVGQLWAGIPDFLVEQIFKGTNQLEITSIQPAQLETNPDSDAFFCSCKILSESGGHFYELNAYIVVRQISTELEPRRWSIVGSSFWRSPPSGGVTVSKTGAQPGAVTYYNLEPGEFMNKWLVLGPLPCPVQEDINFATDEEQRAAFDMDSLDFLNFTPKVNIGNTEYEWALLESEYDMVDLTQLTEGNNDSQIAYLWAQIEVPEDRAGTLGIGSDDSVKVWLNGKLVHENWTVRSTAIDNDRVPVTFKKGMNQIVIKVQNNGGADWGFCCRLLDK